MRQCILFKAFGSQRGVIFPSVLVSVILVLYGSNQLAALGFLPFMLKFLEVLILTHYGANFPKDAFRKSKKKSLEQLTTLF
jgi:archaellum biogenesis protein FlaJ (TadC family)